MLQEFIPGGIDQDWFFHGYCDAASTCRPAFTGVKERSYPAHAGLTSLGRCEPNAVLSDQVTALLGKLGYRGILDLDLRLDRRDGEYKLLDFNPRLGAQFRLFQTTAGVDVATAAYLDLTGAAIPEGAPVAGRRFVVENYDPLGALGYWRRGELSLRAWAASLRGIDETAWFAADDLAPFGLMCLRMGWRLISRPISRFTISRRTSMNGGLVHERGRRRCHRRSGTVRAVGRGAPARGRAELPSVRAADAAVAGGHAARDVPQVAGLRLQPVRSRGQPHPGGVLPEDRPPVRQLRPARVAGHVHQLRPVVRRRAGAQPGRGHGDRGRAARRRLRGQPGQRRDRPGQQRGRGRGRRALRPGAPAAGRPAGRRVHARLGAYRPEHVRRPARRRGRRGPVRAGERRPAARVRRRRPDRRPGRAGCAGTACRSTRTGRCRSGMREPESGLGSGWSTWFYSRHPEIFRHLPEQTRIVPGPHRARPGRRVLAARPGRRTSSRC